MSSMFGSRALVPTSIAERAAPDAAGIVPELVAAGEQRLLTMEETARFFKVSQNTIRNWMREGVLSPRRIHGAVIRFDLAELQAVVERAPRR